MQTLWDLEVGDQVVVTTSYNRTQPPKQMVVVKKGRLLITVDDEGSSESSQGIQFRMEDGSYNSRDYPHHHHVYTLEDFNDRTLRTELIDELRNYRVDIRGTMEVVKLKALLDIVKGVIE